MLINFLISCSKNEEITKIESICEPADAQLFVSVNDVEFTIVGDDSIRKYDLGINDTTDFESIKSRIKYTYPQFQNRYGYGFKPCNLPENLKNNMVVRVSGVSLISKENLNKLFDNIPPPNPESGNGGLPILITNLEIVKK
jgi:hypothetical protein